MKLKSLRVRNFRCYRDEISVDFDDITVFVGKNDIGKSTLLEALGVFFEECSLDGEDASKNGDPKDLTIICEFSDLPSSAIIDENYPTTLEEEFLTNSRGNLEVHKTFNGALKSPKCTSVAVYAKHPSNQDISDLLSLKRKDLLKRAEDLAVDLEDVNKNINSHIRRKIWSSVDDLDYSERLIPLDAEDGKKAWDKIKAYLPAYALFKADRQSSDQDPEAQDPLKAAIKEAIKEKEEELETIAAYIEEEVEKIAKRTVEKLAEMDSSLASELNPKFGPKKWDSLFKAGFADHDDIPLNKRGSGVKRLILLNFFRAKAEQLAGKDGKNVIYAIEEPETSQHPNNQRMLYKAFEEIVENSSSQVILTTHAPAFARLFPSTTIRHLSKNEDNLRLIKPVNDEDSERSIVHELGVLPDHNVKLFFFVEGPNDINFLRGLSRFYRMQGRDVPDLEAMEIDGELIFVIGAGSNLSYSASRLHQLNIPEFHLYDRDNELPIEPHYHEEAKAVNGRPNCQAVHTSKKECENYIHHLAVQNYYRSNGEKNFSLQSPFKDFDDVPQIVAKQLNEIKGSKTWEDLEENIKKAKIKKVKNKLNLNCWHFMTEEWLKEVDPKDEMFSWFQYITDLISSRQ